MKSISIGDIITLEKHPEIYGIVMSYGGDIKWYKDDDFSERLSKPVKVFNIKEIEGKGLCYMVESPDYQSYLYIVIEATNPCFGTNKFTEYEIY